MYLPPLHMPDDRERFDSFVSHSLVEDCARRDGLSGIVHSGEDDAYSFVCLPRRRARRVALGLAVASVLLLCVFWASSGARCAAP